MTDLKPPTSILIIGTGEFGSATALELIKGPYANHASLITMLDRSDDPPARDAACSDMNKIIRQEYADLLYAELAHKALARWRTDEWKDNYYEVGTVVSTRKQATRSEYVARALAVNRLPMMQTPGLSSYTLDGRKAVEGVYPKGTPLGEFADQEVYRAEMGGWGDSRGAVVDTIARLRKAGVKFVAGEAKELLFVRKGGDSFDVGGCVLKDGCSLTADFTICAIGSWTPALLPELATELLPTGQVVGQVKLTEEEYELYKGCPVTRLIGNGFYIFPPNAERIVKFAIHQKGYLNPLGDLPSFPRTTLTPGYETQQVPADAKADLLAGLSWVYPELAKKPFYNTRICWYSDRPTGDWLFDYHEKYPSLFIAAGCCGHGFKFMPVIGELILGSLRRTLPPIYQKIWAYKPNVPGRKDMSREFFSEYKLLDPPQDARL